MHLDSGHRLKMGLLGDYVYTASLTGMNQGTTHQNPHGYVEAPPTDWRL